MRGVILRTDRLRLRPFTAEDVEAAHQYRNDAEFAQFLPHVPHPFTRADAEQFVAVNMTEPWKQFATFAIELDARLIGTVILDIEADTQIAMLGYAISRDHWGEGIAFEAARRPCLGVPHPAPREDLGVHRCAASPLPQSAGEARDAI